jgi:hypothetical protein
MPKVCRAEKRAAKEREDLQDFFNGSQLKLQLGAEQLIHLLAICNCS